MNDGFALPPSLIVTFERADGMSVSPSDAVLYISSLRLWNCGGGAAAAAGKGPRVVDTDNVPRPQVHKGV